MREEDPTVTSLPDRIVNTFNLDEKIDSPDSTTKSFTDSDNDAVTRKDTREDFIDKECFESVLESRSAEFSPRHHVEYQVSPSASTNSNDDNKEQELGSMAEFTFKESTIEAHYQITESKKKDDATADDFYHSNVLMSNLSNKLELGGSDSLHNVASNPKARIDEILRASKARNSIAIQQNERNGTCDESYGMDEPEFNERKADGQFLADPKTSIHKHLAATSDMKMSASFQLEKRTVQDILAPPVNRKRSFEEGKEYTLLDYENTVVTFSSSEGSWDVKSCEDICSEKILQPKLDPCGILLAIDRMWDCLDEKDANLRNLSPATLDSQSDGLYNEAPSEVEGLQQLLPCWNDELTVNSVDFPSDEDSTVVESPQIDGNYSSFRSTFSGSDGESFASFTKRLFDGLELETHPDENADHNRMLFPGPESPSTSDNELIDRSVRTL